MLVDVSAGDNSRNKEFERAKEERGSLLYQVNDYMMEKERLEKTKVKKEVVIKEMMRSLVHLEWSANSLRIDNSLAMNPAD